MLAATPLLKDLVLVGGGHSHVLAIRMLAMDPIAGLRITLVSPDSHTPYSGMLPGLIAGHYSFADAHIDLARLCQWAAIRFIRAPVTGFDPAKRQLSFAGRPPLSYDVVSLDIGSQPELDTVPGAREFSTPVKPVASLWQRWEAMSARITTSVSTAPYQVSLVGGGAGSVELALAMQHRLVEQNVQLDLWCGAAQILQSYNPRARSSVMGALERAGVQVHLNARVVSVAADTLHLQGGERAVYDDLFWCTGASAAPWIAESGLTVDDKGFLAISDTLQSLGDERVFGAGDIATQVAHPRPKAGVYAVRQAPVLAHNLRAVLLGKTLKAHKPQEKFLSLISLGDKTATADRGVMSATGSWVWRWKDRIDSAFMARFDDLPQMPAVGGWDVLPETPTGNAQMVCGGCGAKVGADDLKRALTQLSLDYPEHCVGTGDDTAQVPTNSTPLVQSLDVLRAIVSDPWQMGRIAANHALSDLYASGAQPVSALAAVTLPYASGEILSRGLEQLLAGALHEFSAVGCQLNGGHSMQGTELSLGFMVNGITTAQGRLLAKRGARPGDQLVLSKPLGTGTLFAAHMQLQADGRDIATAEHAMVQSNAIAAQLALTYNASACTDVTGFGLLGHLLEMLGEDLDAQLSLSQLPTLPGALAALEAGIFSTAHDANVRSGSRFLQFPPDDVVAKSARYNLLFDPQTSGGLLIAVAKEQAQPLCEALLEDGHTQASIIGEVSASGSPGVPSVSTV